MSTAARYLGVDLGGTNIKTAVVEVTTVVAGDGPDPAVRVSGAFGDEREFVVGVSGTFGDGQGPAVGVSGTSSDRQEPGRRVVATASAPTLGQGGPAAVLDRLAAAGDAAVEAHGPVVAAGIGVPGLFDTATGSIVLFSNLPGEWAGVAVREPLARAWGVPVAIVNDARALTLAEARMGAAAGAGTVVCMALGTGIGGGVVVDGRLRYGPDGRAGEVGHQVLEPGGPPCGAGCRGCVESLAAAPVLARRAGTATAEEAVVAARSGDPRALEALAVTARHLGHALANLVTVLHPDRIVVGGGVAAAGEDLLAPLRDTVAELSVLVPRTAYDIVPAALGPWAGAIGAALWAAEPEAPRL